MNARVAFLYYIISTKYIEHANFYRKLLHLFSIVDVLTCIMDTPPTSHNNTLDIFTKNQISSSRKQILGVGLIIFSFVLCIFFSDEVILFEPH